GRVGQNHGMVGMKPAFDLGAGLALAAAAPGRTLTIERLRQRACSGGLADTCRALEQVGAGELARSHCAHEHPDCAFLSENRGKPFHSPALANGSRSLATGLAFQASASWGA